MDELFELLNTLKSQNWQRLRYQIENLEKIRAWTVENVIGLEVGDVVEMTECPPSLNGWKPYEPSMQPGRRATVEEIDFNGFYGYWYAGIKFHTELYYNSFHDEIKESEKTHLFAMPIKYLRKVEADSLTD